MHYEANGMMDMVQGASFITLHTNWATAIVQIRQALTSAGFKVLCTFDLQVARSEPVDYVCPIHGTAQCDGQIVMLLVYDRDYPPLTLEVHGHDGLTSFAIVDAPEQRSAPHLAAVISQAIKK